MKQIIPMLIILCAVSADAIQNVKVMPDYEIQVSMYVHLPQSGSMTWISTVRIRDALKKEYVKAWDKGDFLSDFSLTGGKTLTSFQLKPNNNTNPNCILNTPQFQNYYDAYRVISSDVFSIAKEIQLAGKIPVIKFGKMDMISTDGYYRNPKEISPTGTWQ